MKKILVALLIVCASVSVLVAANLPKMQQPVIITSAGQSTDGNVVSVYAKRVKLSQDYQPTIDASQVNWKSVKTLIVVIGGSGKGLGSAGLDIPSEQKRVEGLLKSAKDNGVKIIGMHIGGEDRRKSNSEPFLAYANQCDSLIIREDGNVDGYFTNISKSKNIPMVSIKKTSEVSDLLKEIFL